MPFWKIELPWHGTRVAWYHLVGENFKKVTLMIVVCECS